MKKIAIGSDHAGYPLKEEIRKFLTESGHEITDFGCFTQDACDYPDFAHPVAEAISAGICDAGILMCGSGNGIAMAANKHRNVRAALCWSEEIAVLARKHNNANILSLPARFISADNAIKIVMAFFSASFEGGRHELRVNKINASKG